MGNNLAASGCLPAADRYAMFRLCGAGDPAANQKNRAIVHCGYHKAVAVYAPARWKGLRRIAFSSESGYNRSDKRRSPYDKEAIEMNYPIEEIL